MIKVRYSKVCGRCMLREPLTSGMVGQTIHFEYSHDFDGLMITAVFTDGKNTINVVNPGNECVIPHEVLTTVGATVKVGIYAVKDDKLVIPTIYATIGTVLKGADPSGDISADPTLPVWAQVQSDVGNLNDLTTEAKNNLVAAINEAAASGGRSDWAQNDPTAKDYIKNRPFYSETKTVTVENVTDAKLEGFPAFVTGDTVTVNVDGVEHSLVAYYDEDEGVFTVGDIYSSIENGEGQLGWQIYAGDTKAYFYAKEAHTISYLGVFIYKIDDKFLNLDGLVRTFDYHFKDYALYKTLYNSAGDECTLYTSSDFILPKPKSKLFGCMSELGFSIVDSVDLYSCFITGVKIDTINSRISIVRVVLGTDTSDMETMAADNGYTYTTNPKA